MCLILFAWKNHPSYKLILAANRDEFYSRRTAEAGFWDEHPEVLGGRDLVAGGTWMGITKSGRFAAITNYRDPATVIDQAVSRGYLTRDFLIGKQSPSDYLQEIGDNRNRYLGFNLLIGDQRELWYYNNVSNEMLEVAPGTYSLSNAYLNSKWPKTDSGKALFESKLKDQINQDDFFEILSKKERAEDSRLPKTGVPIELERALSPIFIETESYGTCSSSFAAINENGLATFIEKTHPTLDRQSKTVSFHFMIS